MLVDHYSLRTGTPSDAGQLAELYANCFPKHTRSKLGSQVCKKFFDAALASKAYLLLLAQFENNPVGFSMLHIDRTVSLGRCWVKSAMPYALAQCILDPRLATSLIADVVRKRVARICSLNRTGRLSETYLDSAYIDFIGVSPSFRGQGIARKLIDYSIQTAREHGRREVKLTVEGSNVEAIALYSRAGFLPISFSESSSAYVYQYIIKQ